jgi:hypothetical protein
LYPATGDSAKTSSQVPSPRRNPIPPQQTADPHPIKPAQGVETKDAGHSSINFEIVQPAGGQHEFPVTKPFGETDAGLMNITEAHTKSQSAGSKAFTGGGLLLCHDTKPQLL